MKDVILRNNLVLQKLLRCETLGDLIIYTYTDKCVQENQWDEITLNSRGHIFNRMTGECVARPFPKFFNLNEKPNTQEKILPWHLGYSIYEKLDGWLGTLYRHDGKYAVATRGSFHSEMAQWATEYLQEKFPSLSIPDDITLVFEIIHPKTKIVVDYRGEEALKLLAAFNRHTGEEYCWEDLCLLANQYSFQLPKTFYGSIDDIKKQLQSSNGQELEGFVVRFDNGLRIKLKSTDYLRRAHIVANITPLKIWAAFEHGSLPGSYIEMVGPEYLDDVYQIEKELAHQYDTILSDIASIFNSIYRNEFDRTLNRKKFSERAFNLPFHNSIMFAILDGKQDSIEKYVMNLIRPDNNQFKKYENTVDEQ